MGVSRRFLNMIVRGCSPGIKSLRRINLTRQQLFYTPALLKKKMGMIRLPDSGGFTLKASNIAWKLDCFPLADCKVICMDQSGHGFFLDLHTRKVSTMPHLRKPAGGVGVPITVYVPPNPELENDINHCYCNGSSLFLMERTPQPEFGGVQEESEQFVGFINHIPLSDRSWHCRLLTPPPFVREPHHWNNNCCPPQITAYGVVGGGSHVCISVKGVGTYCLDTASHVWSQVGKWTLPFHGKVEYVPEHKLWFGLSAHTQRLAAADLSNMDSQPQLVVGPCKELNSPEEWKECKESQFVSLGSGRFCIARFFQVTSTTNTDAAGFGDDDNFAVLTGVEVNSQGSSSNGKLQMTPHKSKRVNNTSIESVF